MATRETSSVHGDATTNRGSSASVSVGLFWCLVLHCVMVGTCDGNPNQQYMEALPWAVPTLIDKP